MKKLILIPAYVCFAVVLTVVLLIFRFPKDQFISFVESKIEHTLAGYTCELSGLTYVYPFSLHADTLILAKKQSPFVVPIQNIMISGDRRALFKGYRVSFDIFGGSVRSAINYVREKGTLEFSDLIVSDIDPEDIPMVHQHLGRRFSGVFTFGGILVAQLDALGKTVVTGNLTISNFQTELRRPILLHNSVAFDTITMSLHLQGNRLDVAEGMAKGPLYNGDFAGHIAMAPEWRGALINISGSINPSQEYIRRDRQVARAAALLYKKYKNTRIPYRISGSFRDPVFQFGGLPGSG